MKKALSVFSLVVLAAVISSVAFGAPAPKGKKPMLSDFQEVPICEAVIDLVAANAGPVDIFVIPSGKRLFVSKVVFLNPSGDPSFTGAGPQLGVDAGSNYGDILGPATLTNLTATGAIVIPFASGTSNAIPGASGGSTEITGAEGTIRCENNNAAPAGACSVTVVIYGFMI